MGIASLIALIAGVVVGMTGMFIMQGSCFHSWEPWEETRGLLITVHDEWGGKTHKSYRRFERTCQKCGKCQLRKKKDS